MKKALPCINTKSTDAKKNNKGQHALAIDAQFALS